MSYVDNQPLRYWNGNAVYLTLYLTIGMAVGIVAVLLLSAANVPLGFFTFHPVSFLHGWLWQPLTYVFVNRLGFFTPLSLICFYSWGVEVEKYMGRRFFIGLCAALVIVPALFSLVLYPLGFGLSLETDYYLVIGILIAFATLYPNMDYLGGWVPLKWFAFVMVACGSITFFPPHDWVGLAALWLACLTAFVMVRRGRGLLEFSFRLPKRLRREPALRVLPRAEGARPLRGPQPQPRLAASTGSEAEMDALLDKIAREGLASLTDAERERLEHARQELLRKGR